MDREIAVVQAAVHEAGQQVLQLAAHGFETHIKHDRSPVTTADLAVNRILQQTLLHAFPGDGWLSEETPDDPARLKKSRVWVIDPIDGTKYFMTGVPQYAISVALVEEQRPTCAVIYNPATNELFTAIKGRGAWLNQNRLRVRADVPAQPAILVNPSGHRRDAFRVIDDAVECRPMGSIAYTLALVAAGRSDGTINVDRLNEWDIAAGVLLIEEAGGCWSDMTGSPVPFNQLKTAIRGVLASNASLHPSLVDLAKRLKP